MNDAIKSVKIGLLMVMLTLVFGIGLGITFGVAEDSLQSYISTGVAAHADLHDDKSSG